MKPTIVVSAVNLVEGGTLTILHQCLSCLNSYYASKYNIIALVHSKELFHYDNIDYCEFTWVKKSWIRRIYFEYVYCLSLSKKLKPHLWLSLHDITPNIIADLKVVYCHNPSPFLKTDLKLFRYNYKEFLFSLFYKWIYRINIKKNTLVIVQQKWLKCAFARMFDIPLNRIAVARPNSLSNDDNNYIVTEKHNNKETLFFYPAFPRSFKNFEIIGEACKLLENSNNMDFKILITIKGDENTYAREIYKKYHNLSNLVFMGRQSKDKINEIYNVTDCLVFPSKLETWGLPISEFAVYERPMILSDLPYAHETSAGANKVLFFNPDSVVSLYNAMLQVIRKDLSNFNEVPAVSQDKLSFNSWTGIMDFILEKDKTASNDEGRITSH